jgi:hypothetical protein
LTENGSNAPGVTLRFQHAANISTTKSDGTFKITAASLPDTLVFSAAGFEPYKVVITEKNIGDPDFEVVLLKTRKTLHEVSVKSYLVSRELRNDASIPSGNIDAEKFYFPDTSIVPREGALAKSRILTAGEVNDFNKWSMWEDYSVNEFKTYSNLWGMKTSKRFCLQLTGKKQYAVMHEAVFLINKNTLDTVWRTYTDNTGKAELWAGFLNDSTEKGDYYISDSYRHTLFNPTMFANGVNVLAVDKPCQLSNDVDIAFVVDATGSMKDEIEFLKLELEDVVRNTMEKYKSLTLRASAVFYRDKGDEYLTRMSGFSDDLLKTLNFIKLQRAEGGGDYPEAVDKALGTALDSLQWNKETRAKILFLVLDAPPHHETIQRMQQLTIKAAAMGIRIVPIACSGTDKSTEFLLRSMALATNGTYTFLTNNSGVGNSHIEPTTDKYEVELLNNLLQRIIGQLLFAKDCSKEEAEQMQQQEIKHPGNVLSIKIFPNPASGQFTIESSKDIKELFITDFTGKILIRLISEDLPTGQAGKKGKWKVDIGNYPSGAYLVKYITTENKWGAEEVILMK